MPAILGDAGYQLDELHSDDTEGIRWLSFTYQGTARPA
jgi:hypothetical protein